MLDNSAQRCRLPPPGFSHMNAFGIGVPRAPAQTSKILPFMNNGGNVSQQSHNWPHHSGQPQQNMNYGVHDQMSNLLSKQNHLVNKNSAYCTRPIDKRTRSNGQSYFTGFGNSSDWSLIDPAIVSFRPYQQSFVSGPSQQSQSDMFISPNHIAQQQFENNKMKSSEFPNRNSLMQSSYGAPHGLNLQNGIMGQQQTNSQQVSVL